MFALWAATAAGAWAARGAVAELEAVAVLPVDGPDAVDPSGLCVVDGALLTVSDKNDSTIFRVEWSAEEGTARMVPHLRFRAPDDAGTLDLEGLVPDGAGGFFVVSEAHWRVLHVAKDGGARWIGPSVKQAGDAVGLFATRGGGLEGLGRFADGVFLLAAERQPRGFVLMHSDARDDGAPAIYAWQTDATRFAAQLPAGRSPDWADLCVFNGRVFGLFRNAHLIVELEERDGRWQESAAAWSYAATENDPRNAYAEKRFGHGEGLAMDERHIYVMLDNNRAPRATDHTDRRPLLLVFKRP